MPAFTREPLAKEAREEEEKHAQLPKPLHKPANQDVALSSYGQPGNALHQRAAGVSSKALPEGGVLAQSSSRRQTGSGSTTSRPEPKPFATEISLQVRLAIVGTALWERGM